MKTDTSTATVPIYPMPLVRVDLVVLSVVDKQLRVLLGYRQEAPYKDTWGLPGGVLRIDLDASLEAGAQRVAQERLGRSLPNLNQVTTVGGAKRDPRAPWAMSIVFRSLVRADLETKPGKRVQALEWKTLASLSTAVLAFDHSALIARAVESVRSDVRNLQLESGWLPDEFTIPELQGHCEAVLGEKLDKVTFRRRLEAGRFLHAIEGKARTGAAHRPAQLFCIPKLELLSDS